MPNNNSEERKKAAAKLLAQDLDTLYAHLAESQADRVGQFFSQDEQISFGRKYFGKLESSLRKQVCVDWKYCEKKKDRNYQDASAIVIAIADTIAAGVLGVPAVVVAAILAKRGLDAFCQCPD